MSKSLNKVVACLLAALMTVFSVPFTALAHEHELTPHAEVPATCTEPGTQAYWECETCNLLFSDSEGENTIEQPAEIAAKGHAWGNWIKIADEVPATETTNGRTAIEARICTNNTSHRETRGGEVIPATGQQSDDNRWETDPVSFVTNINDCTVSGIVNKVYTGADITQSVTVKDNGKKKKKNADYTLSYTNNRNVGTATVTITGKGFYTGSKKLTFRITALDISKCTVSGIPKSRAYTGKAITPNPAIKHKTATLKKGVAYSVAYSDNKRIGVATIKISGKGNYKGSVNKTFTIVPKGTSAKLASPKKTVLKISWKKQAVQTSGYEIQYSTASKFPAKSTKKAVVKNPKLTAKTIKKLRSKKKYYVRIRTYKKAGKKTYYSSWSKTENIKIK